MPYVILGIIVLIVSFVIALVSLVYEQRKVEERKSEEEGDLVVAANGGAGSMVPNVTQGQDTELPLGSSRLSTLSGANLPGDQTQLDSRVVASQTRDDDVWWNDLVGGSSGTGNVLPDSEEQKSILAIQEELARMTSAKTGTNSDQASLGGISDDKDSHQVRSKSFLSGEFSLADIRKKD
ncbi:MAG: hypothetical protein UU23_C0001G0010 [Candidatus Curtissbacteria bacterium GW2011_GWA1_40_9]|uniref:Uncharacterized protein n=1 Tax=Candidatus Curtissbacteria bacterium GW2011_GWA1_40_9 TaxID=1618408 RepID=A0A0G0TTV5_9BACT|nr:MAG: hypothetical protein UU23_C0001G0010 [Candidatus Curtissbacteria bacterium GW2011_GWA1_40_9]